MSVPRAENKLPADRRLPDVMDKGSKPKAMQVPPALGDFPQCAPEWFMGMLEVGEPWEITKYEQYLCVHVVPSETDLQSSGFS